MKKLTIILALVFATTSIFAQLKRANNNRNETSERTPLRAISAKTVNSTDAIWDVLFSFSANSSGQQAVETDGTNLFTAAWGASGIIKKYSTAGALLDTFEITGVAAGIRDLCYDGTYFYGRAGATATSLYKMDFNTKTLISTISLGTTAVRHLAYDPTLDGGNGGFWAGDWTTLASHKMDGTLIQSVTLPATVSDIYGSTFDNASAGGPYLWFFTQPATPSNMVLVKYKISDNTVFSTYNVATATVTGLDVAGIAGGLGGSATLVPGKFVLLGNVQQDPNKIFCIDAGANDTIDAGVTAITAPVQGGTLTATTQVKVKVKNHLTATLTNIPVTCKVNSTTLTGTVAGPLAPNAEVEYTFTNTVDMSAFGTYNFVAFTSLATDQNKANDTLKTSIVNLPSASINWNFNQGIPSTFTLINDANTAHANVLAFTNAWVATVDDNITITEDSCVGSTSWFTPAGTADRWMITPKITLTTGNILQWDAKAQDPGFRDGYSIKISTTGTNKTDFTTTLYTTAEEESTWTNRNQSLNAFNGQNVYVAFIQNSNDMFVIKMDNIKILGNASVGINEVSDNSNFRIYPNPAKNVLNINTDSKMSSIKIVNSLGQTIFNTNASSNSYKVNTSNYNKGIYFVEIQTENGKITKKFMINE